VLARPGTVVRRTVDPFSLLRTFEAIFHVAPLALAAHARPLASLVGP
jgi:hypothetical protein